MRLPPGNPRYYRQTKPWATGGDNGSWNQKRGMRVESRSNPLKQTQIEVVPIKTFWIEASVRAAANSNTVNST